MSLSRNRKASIALLMLAMLAFTQTAVALTVCSMERGVPTQMTADGHACESAAPGPMNIGANGCVAHCTSDLQQAGFAIGLVPDAADAPALLVSLLEPSSSRHQGLDSPPPGAPPRRILLHSFLI
jgi:hypothetical protein